MDQQRAVILNSSDRPVHRLPELLSTEPVPVIELLQLFRTQTFRAQVQLPDGSDDGLGESPGSDLRAYLLKCDRTLLQLARNTVLNVEPDPNRHPRQRCPLPARFTQDPSEFSMVEHEIVGPFKLWSTSGKTLDGARDSKANPDTHHLEPSHGLRPKQHAEPESPDR